ncbi:KaiB domain protein [Candidatus Magnetoovum chiemensis]|nr:KaiB domain protein [Candidatus Magnetoovum chiemensis]
MSKRAIDNLNIILSKYFSSKDAEISVIDINEDRESAFENNVIATPTLVKISPHPVRKVIGDLSNIERVFFGLGLQYLLSNTNGNN